MAAWTNYPVDTEDTFYLENSEYTLHEIFEKAKEKWPEINMEDISIECEYRHVECLNYDFYDAGDYKNYLIIKKIKK